MAIEAIESFQNLNGYLGLKYVGLDMGFIDAGGGRFPGQNCLRFTASGDFIEVAVSDNATMGMACGFRWGGGSNTLFWLGENTTNHVGVSIDSTGKLFATRNGAQIGSASTDAIIAGSTWYHVEMKAVIADAGGSVQVWVNGVLWVNVTGADTRNGGSGIVNRVRIDPNANATTSYCDWVVWSGSTGPVGDCRVVSILPDAAGATTQMTPTGGANYLCVDEASDPNGDSDYVSEDTAGQLDTYGFAAVGLSGTVKALQVNVWARKDDAGSRTLAPVIRAGGTDYAGTAKAVLDTYTAVVKQVYEQNPNTSAAWTVAGIDAAEFGQKLVS